MSVRTGDAADGAGSRSADTGPAEDPKYDYGFWNSELTAAKERLKDYFLRGDKVIKKFLDVRGDGDAGTRKVNLFNANVTVIRAMLFDSIPEVEVVRTFEDFNDDEARVAATILERAMNREISVNGEEYDTVVKAALEDRLLPGGGQVRVRYEYQEQTINHAPIVGLDGRVMAEGYEEKVLEWEKAALEYVHWRDCLWGWGRTWSELPWFAFRAYLTKQEIETRFGAEIADHAEYAQQHISTDKQSNDPDKNSRVEKAEVWEIWCKTTKTVYWKVKGIDKLADTKPDPLQLPGFLPCPPMMVANPTTSLLIPTADYYLAQDLYEEIDHLQTRINIITDAIKVVGVYDQAAPGVKRMMQEGVENDLIPVENWASFAENQGLEGAIDWLPIDSAVAALGKLVEARNDAMALLHEVTGMSDIMRGKIDDAREGNLQTQMKGRFASVRMQDIQNRFAKFVTDAMQLKLALMVKHYAPETLVKLSNIERTPDVHLIGPALQLIKGADVKFRIKIQSDKLALEDKLEKRTERADYLSNLGVYMQSVTGMAQNSPEMAPLLFELMKWGLAGYKGSDEIESVLDMSIQALVEKMKKQAQQPPPPSPEMIKAQARMAELQEKSKAKLQEIQAKAQADLMIRQQDLQADSQSIQAQAEADLMVLNAEMQSAIEQIVAKMEADIASIQQDTAGNMQQNALQVEAEIRKDAFQAAIKLREIQASTQAKIAEARAKPKPTSQGG